jgi:hypothetical protein
MRKQELLTLDVQSEEQMTTQIIPFESAKLPANVSSLFSVSNDLGANVGGGGYPHVSIKGKVFHITRGDERTLVTKPNEDEPAASIEVVIVKANAQLSKVFYEGGYSEGSEAKPTCYSNDGISPAADAQEAQAKKCAACPHNQWGSRITDNGGKGKACADSRRVAIASLNLINDPMLLRVPAASLKTLQQYNELLAKRGVPYQAVVTKIGFDYTVAHPALTFKPVGFIDDETAAKVYEVMNSDVVSNIIGAVSTPAIAPAPIEAEDAPVAVKPKAKPVETSGLDAVLEKAKPTAKVKTETAEPEVEAAPVVKEAKPVEVQEVNNYSELMAGLDNMLLGDDDE